MVADEQINDDASQQPIPGESAAAEPPAPEREAADTPGSTSGEAGAESVPAAASSADQEAVEATDAESQEEQAAGEELQKDWYILKVQVNREDSIREALLRRIKIEGLEEYFGEIVVPTEDVAEFNKSGKRRIVRRKLYPGYILINMTIDDDTWFLVRETPGVGDFTGSAGKPTPMDPHEVERILRIGVPQEEGAGQIKTAIPFKAGDRVRVKDGHFQNFEGEVDAIDEANGRITVMINIFNRSTPVELEHWQVEAV
jgi:transcriptional antiterminator NusG